MYTRLFLRFQFAVCAAVAFGVCLPPMASAADPTKCQQYAQQAVAHQQQNLSLGCNFVGPRWQSNKQAHYNWCLVVPDMFVNGETQTRLNDLSRCRGNAQAAPQKPKAPSGNVQSRRQACNDYAAAAVAQGHQNNVPGCRFSGPRWSTDHKAHVAWCMAVPGQQSRNENRVRQTQLATCQKDQSCVSYAKTAVTQSKRNAQQNCGYTGARWNPSYEFHFRWCRKGKNKARSQKETAARNADLQRCGKPSKGGTTAANSLDGDFKITSIRPNIGAGGLVEVIDMTIEANSSRPWKIGAYGHHRYGSLWVEVTATNKVWQNGGVRDKSRTYLFSIRGNAAGTQSLAAPAIGTQVPAGRRAVRLTVSPVPRIKLKGVKRMFSTPSAPFAPGELGCWSSYPRIDVKVYVVTSNNLGTVRHRSTGDIQTAPLGDPVFIGKQGGFNTGVVYSPC